YKKASARPGVTGEILLTLCESRLDNTVYRLGIAPTRSGARQLVGHGHITVNGDVVNIASYMLRPGDRIAVREKSKSLQSIVMSLSNRTNFDWLDWNDSDKSGVYIKHPERVQIPENIKEQLIVELYSK
ncbi:MAG: ribosomal protein, partial [Bacteroidota bacterium]